ncbi:hypothetical protein OS493_026641 [Desmophyllum pertusum]|uniref:Kinase D-interacting substrate of 220 kDa-like SAM domain-containing protein n=1 Tax=Desmophyllum pertusum TaxID=174260 RepID=A0A9W9YA64_9CNID|nr:hypothetical protein OS493_026641 [Desmophyllum pertusum]
MLEFNGENCVPQPHRLSRDLHNCNGGVPSQVHPDMELHHSMMYEPAREEEERCLDHQKLLDRELELEERRRISTDLAQVLADNETVNPLGVKRLMNIVSLTCRLLRARGIEYSWKRLAAWVSIVDGWPYKTSWLVLLIEDSNTRLQDNVSLKDLYEATLSAMPVINEVDCAVDGDPVYFETFLASHHPLLSTSDVRRFLPCTVHLDPSLRRQMVECLQSGIIMAGNKSDTGSVGKGNPHLQVGATARSDKQASLPSLSIEDVCKQIAELDGLDQKQISTYQTVITENNINGKVLATCDLNELGHIMGMTFGDWQLFRAWVLAARNPAQECTACHLNSRCVSPGEMNCQLLKTSSGGWDHVNPLTATGRNSADSAEQVPQEYLLSKAPDIVLQPPSVPESEEEEEEEEEEDNNGETVDTAETELEKEEENIARIDEIFDEEEEKATDVGLDQIKTKEDSVLISLGEDINLPPPELPAAFDDDDDNDDVDDNDNELPAPPPCGTDLITFSESEDQRERSDLENDILTAQPSDSGAQWKKTHTSAAAMECTCEGQLHAPLKTLEPVQELKPSKNSLFFDTEDSEEVGRPAPIVLTRNRNGPVKSAVAVKRSNSSSGSSTNSSGSCRSPLLQSVSVDLSREKSAPSLSLSMRQHSLPEPSNMARPYSATDIVTIEHPPKFLKKTHERPRVDSDSDPEPFAQASDPLIPDTLKEEKDLKRFSRDSNDFPPPPPPIEDSSTFDQGDSPWVPLMTRFQVEAGNSSVSESEEPLLPQRRPRPKTATGANEQKVPKFRTYTPKPTYVGAKNGQQQSQKSETCV